MSDLAFNFKSIYRIIQTCLVNQHNFGWTMRNWPERVSVVPSSAGSCSQTDSPSRPALSLGADGAGAVVPDFARNLKEILHKSVLKKSLCVPKMGLVDTIHCRQPLKCVLKILVSSLEVLNWYIYEYLMIKLLSWLTDGFTGLTLIFRRDSFEFPPTWWWAPQFADLRSWHQQIPQGPPDRLS